jgi:uncharacterized membrane protein
MSGGVRFFSAGPISILMIVLLIGLAIIFIPLMIFGIIGAAFTRLGFSWISALAIVLFMVFGSFVNIPLYRIRREMVQVSRNETSDFDVCVPCSSTPVWDTLVSINLGGAVIPICVSLYMLYGTIMIMGISLIITVFIAIALVGIVAFLSTRLVPCSGLQVPLLIPGLTALLAGLILTGGIGLTAAVTAFVGGTTGVLLGGNIANFYRIKNLDVTAVSFGGAGTFGSIFICCILPALIA